MYQQDAPCRTLPVRTLRAGVRHDGSDCVAEEVPVAFEFNGISHAVMMASPADLEDFATGFSLCEGIIDGIEQLRDIEVVRAGTGCTLRIDIASQCFMRLKERRRNLAGRTGCGLCGTESLEHAVRPAQRVEGNCVFTADAVARAVARMRGWQTLGAATGTTHAAMWCDADGGIRLVREDVGRHNALDKLVGAMARGRNADAAGFIVVSSRASYEMVQKTAAAGVGLLVAVSGVTALAIDMASDCGVELAGFARGGDVSVYTQAGRLSLGNHVQA